MNRNLPRLALALSVGLAACSDSSVSPTDLTADAPTTAEIGGTPDQPASPTAVRAGMRANSTVTRPSGGYVNSAGDLVLEQNVPLSNSWYGWYTDLVSLQGSLFVRVSKLNVYACGSGPISAYMRDGSSIGAESSASGWSLVGEVVGPGSCDYIDIPLTTPYVIPTGATAGLLVWGNRNASISANSVYANSQTSDANLRLNQAPGRWANDAAIFTGTQFLSENPRPQLRVTYALFSNYSGPCVSVGGDCQQTGAGGGPLTPSTPPGGTGLGAPGSAGPGAPGAPGGSGGRILPPGNRPPV